MTIEEQKKIDHFDLVNVAEFMLEGLPWEDVLNIIAGNGWYLDQILIDWEDRGIIDDEDYAMICERYPDRIAIK